MVVGLWEFLRIHRCPGGTTPSHTSIGGSGAAGGSYDVPTPEYSTFLNAYIAELKAGRPLSLTERPSLYFPVIADIDLEYAVDGVQPDRPTHLSRVHDDAFLKKTVSMFAESIVSLCNTPRAAHSIEAILMQRTSPYIKSANTVRDGIHLMLPQCVMTRSAQSVLRTRLLTKMDAVLCSLPGQSIAPSQSLDACYSENNANWQMYGSSKPGRTPYLVTHTVRAVVNQGECISTTLHPVDDPDAWSKWVPMLSVRQGHPDKAWPLSEEAQAEVDQVEEERAKRQFTDLQTRGGLIAKDAKSSTSSASVASAEDEARARSYVRCLSNGRAEAYETWRNVGFALRNTSSRLVDVWHEFSARSPKYDRRVCQMFWDRLHPDKREGPKLTLGSLSKWAEEDNPSLHSDVQQNNSQLLLFDAIRGNTHTDWGRYVCAMLPDRLASVRSHGSGRGDRTLYVFHAPRWQQEPCGSFIKMYLKTEVVKHVEAYVQERPEDAELAKLAQKAISSLKTKGFRENVLGDITENVGDDRLLEKLDSKRHLIGWNNGVFDLEAQHFRDGKPDDYVTMSTGHDYVDPDQTPKTAKEVQAFLEKVHVNPVFREYCLNSLSVALSGVISFEHMHCWTGTGSNGKSRTVKLLDEGLGDYMKTLPPSLLTGVRPESGKPTPELCSAAGARIVVMSEVDGKATINVAVMKELSGGDKIAVRALYGGASTIKPQFTMFMTCNDLSKVDANDDGTWRRLKVLPYKSKFVLENPRNELEFKADNSMDDKISSWAPFFISMLQSRYHTALEAMRHEPSEITEQVKLYRIASDRDADFVHQNLIKITEQDDEEWEEADAWVLLDMYKREGRDRDITLSKLIEKLQRFEIPAPVTNNTTGTSTIPGYRIALRTRS